MGECVLWCADCCRAVSASRRAPGKQRTRERARDTIRIRIVSLRIVSYRIVSLEPIKARGKMSRSVAIQRLSGASSPSEVRRVLP